MGVDSLFLEIAGSLRVTAFVSRSNQRDHAELPRDLLSDAFICARNEGDLLFRHIRCPSQALYRLRRRQPACNNIINVAIVSSHRIDEGAIFLLGTLDK